MNPAPIITLANGELLPHADGYVARFLAMSGDKIVKLEIPIPDGKYQEFGTLPTLRMLLSGSEPND